MPSLFFPAYFLFFSALIVTIRSDLETMLISRFVSLFLVPVGCILSFFGYLPLSLTQSILGALFGYFILFAIAAIFKKLSGKEGMGQGDIELLAFIGSFLGITGAWLSLFIGSIAGSLIGLIILARNHHAPGKRIPFGPFLALGAISFVLFHEKLIALICF